MLRSFLKKERWKNTRVKEQDPEDDKNERRETIHATKFTRYVQKEEANTKFRRKLTRKAILDMMESQHLTMEEGEIELKGLGALDMEHNKSREQQVPEKNNMRRKHKKKITRKAILDMLQSGHLTRQECKWSWQG